MLGHLEKNYEDSDRGRRSLWYGGSLVGTIGTVRRDAVCLPRTHSTVLLRSLLLPALSCRCASGRRGIHPVQRHAIMHIQLIILPLGERVLTQPDVISPVDTIHACEAAESGTVRHRWRMEGRPAAPRRVSGGIANNGRSV
jgi:hypothetical protein